MVDLPGPAPLRRTGASQPPQRRLDVASQKAKPKGASSTPAQLVSLASRIAAGPAPRDEVRIAKVRDAIDSGTYEVNPDEIARAILGDG